MDEQNTQLDWFKDVFDIHYENIRNYIYYMSGDMELAEDLVQDVFLKVWEKRDKVKPETVRSLLFTIAKNLYYNTHKRKKLDIRFINSLFEENDNVSPEYILELKEFDEKLQNAISSLPDRCRTVFLMSRIDEMKQAEIAESLGVTVKAVEKQITKALKLLKEKVNRKL